MPDYQKYNLDRPRTGIPKGVTSFSAGPDPVVPPGPRPNLDTDTPPDTTADRAGFEKTMVGSKFGGMHPYETTSDDFVERWDQRYFKDHFNNVFKGTRTYEDRAWMTNKEKVFWNKEVSRKHAVLRKQADKKLKEDRKYYDNMMGAFDKDQSDKMQIWKENQIVKRAVSKAEVTAKTKADKPVDMGKIMKDVQSYTDSILGQEFVEKTDSIGDKIRTSWKNGDKVSKSGLRKINAYRKIKGLAVLKEVKDTINITDDKGKPATEDIFDYIADEVKTPEPTGSPDSAQPEGYPVANEAALQYLKDNPGTADKFEEHFGYRP